MRIRFCHSFSPKPRPDEPGLRLGAPQLVPPNSPINTKKVKKHRYPFRATWESGLPGGLPWSREMLVLSFFVNS